RRRRLDEALDGVGRHRRVRPQRPPDRLADEELAVAGPQPAVAEEPLGVGLVLGGELVQQGGAGHPEVVVGDPVVHRGDQRGVGPHERPGGVGGQGVHRVPPRLGGDQLVDHLDEPGAGHPDVAAEVVGTGVLELALRLGPQRPGDGGQLLLGGGREVAQRGAGQPPPLGRRDPEERELVAHVGRGAHRPLGVGGGLVGGAQPRDDLVRQRAHGRATAATARPGHPAAGRTAWSAWRPPRTSLMTLIATRAPPPAVMIVWTLTPATVPAAQMPGTEVRPSASTDTICLMRGSVPGTVATPAASASLTLVPVARMTWAAVSSRPSASRTVKAPALPSTASAAPSIQVAPDFSACSRPRATSSGPLMPSGSPRWLFTSARRVIPLSSSTTT